MRLLVVILSLFAIQAAVPTIAHAVGESPVEFTVPGTALTVQGYASPGALVSIYDSEALVGTVVANNDGFFTKNFSSFESGLHNLRLSYVDANGIMSDEVSDTLNVQFQQDTAVEYFLPPTLEIIPGSVTQGGLVSIRGSTIPGATVEIRIDGGNTIVRPQAGPDGTYTIAFGTADYFIGGHPLRAIASRGDLTSFPTLKDRFSVLPIPSSEAIPLPDNGVPAPVIESPQSPASVDSEEVLIQGTSLPNSQLIIYLDSEAIGSTFTNSEGVWFFNIRMTKAQHTVQAVACVGDTCSGFSNSLTLNFRGSFTECRDFRFILTQYRFWGVQPDDGVDIRFGSLTGVAPYEMIVDWGDQTVERFNHDDEDGFTLHHVYREVGQFNGVVSIQDDRGCIYERYIAVEVVEKEFQISAYWWTIPLGIAGTLYGVFRIRERRLTSASSSNISHDNPLLLDPR